MLERYPGSESPSGYRSNVTLIDEEVNLEKPFSIYMNNILKYRGYRFYQSSYDQGRAGNDPFRQSRSCRNDCDIHRIWLTISVHNPLSFQQEITFSYYQGFGLDLSSAKNFSGCSVFNNRVRPRSSTSPGFVPGREAAAEFGKVLVQDQNGRTKPLYTLSSDILRKVSQSNRLGNYTPMQVFVGVWTHFDTWKDVPLIRISNKDLQKMLGLRSNTASFTDLVRMEGSGSYRLSKEVDAAYGKAPGERNKFDKEVMKVDERLNIVFMIYRSDFMKIFPLKNGTSGWGKAEDALKNAVSADDSVYLQSIVPLLSEALQENQIAKVREICASVKEYQHRFTEYELPSELKIRGEQLYYKTGIFEKLFPFYTTVGILMLIVLIAMLIAGKKEKILTAKLPSWLLLAGLVFHTFGLALRWYISGHSPMSNGYESLVFISWITLLAGFIFSRRSEFALAATAVLSGLTLLVAHMSFMDPEITNLVPVLKSYWLTLHVSVIISSYGFLGLGAILGIIIMILIVLSNLRNRERISETIDELTVINYKTLTLGLYFLTIGTFLGAVWANESWGRYWGWDPKETWSLITIIVYALVIHSRMIPGMKDLFTFNLLSLFSFSSVLMTYFGVNYYLSGLHSYASGDPVPVPGFVYIAVLTLIALSVAAWLRYNSVLKENKSSEKQ